MRKKIVFVCSIFVLLSCSPASSEQLGIQKKKKNLEQDAMHALMKKLESLYKLSATDNGEIFNKEIDALKKQIDQLHQHGGGNEGESLGHLLESEAADDSGKKTIFGVDEDDLDNYDADFIGQSKGKIKGQADTTAVAKPPAHRDSSASGGGTEGQQPDPASARGSQASGGRGGGDQTNTTQPAGGQQSSSAARSLQAPHAGDSQLPNAGGDPQPPNESGHPQSLPAAENSQPPPAAPVRDEGTAVTPPPASTATPPKGTADSNDAKIKYLDKLYDEVLTTSDNTSGIHVPDYHSKYNTIRQKYEYSMNPVEYEIVKNLFNVGFKKEGDTSAAASLVDVFKKALADETFQAEFDNFVHGLYGFAKRHNYLSEARMKGADRYTNLLKNAISLMYTI
ncbi:merozoite surface protein 7 (MSP7) [Plasmodium vivax India VII]|uniref:Merozoite surface protein 7 (MSP7) n=1 Tax=Plasmodium vivax India VII TaxID=1077284 RepID=A0A0J9S8R4_PLAVI|nr:merozoite surface protein 7 (MSP7) [Plasmodium vivax India VII]